MSEAPELPPFMLAEHARAAIGLFGGRFDPVHRAHLGIARAAADTLKLKEVRWIVAGTPPHKPANAPASDRLEMVRLALQSLGDPRMVVDDREILAAKRGESNYTADTLKGLLKEFPTHRLVWILGADQIKDFTTWSRWEWIIQHTELAVCQRPQSNPLNTVTRLRVAGAVIHEINVTPDSVSSSDIRSTLTRGNSITGLTPDSVVQYITQHRLYV